MHELRADAGRHDRRQLVLTRDDGGVRHDAATIGDGGGDAGKDDRPARRRERADENLAVFERLELLDPMHDPGDAFGHAGRGGETARSRSRRPTPYSAASHRLIVSLLIPKSVTVIGSVTFSGGTPRAGGGFQVSSDA